MRSTARPRAHLFRLNPLMAACGVLLGSVSVQAQETKKEDAQPVESVIVTGIRKSLDTSLDLKRSARGLVDGIVAEDIGKFPDTNLAESLGRISGVSIERNNGEGTRFRSFCQFNHAQRAGYAWRRRARRLGGPEEPEHTRRGDDIYS